MHQVSLKEVLFSKFHQSLFKIRTETTFQGCSQGGIKKIPKLQYTEGTDKVSPTEVICPEDVRGSQTPDNCRRHGPASAGAEAS